MPGDPQINEAGCIFMLQQEINAETLPYHQNAAIQVIIDLYDRKVSREEFLKSAGTAVSFYATLAKLYVIEQTHALTVTNTLTLETVDTATAKLHVIAADKAAALVKIMVLLAECPTSEDKVH
jgi:hypothetical protein